MGVKADGLSGFARVNKVTSASLGYPLSISNEAIKRPRTRSTAARQVSNAHERDIVTNQNV